MLYCFDIMLFYENMLAVNNISLKIEEGQIVGIFGANGAGKSSLMKVVSGLIWDYARKEQMRGGERVTLMGRIEYLGHDISNYKAHERARLGIVLCPERRRIFPESSVLENLRIGAYLAKRDAAQKTLKYVFELFPSLERLKYRQAGFLSGGEQQMLAIGRALMAQPKLLLLDEPLLGLSPAVQATLVKAIKEIREKIGITILVTEQYARPMLPIVDYAYVVENGALVIEGTAQELLENPDVRSAYLGI